jgi:hypothetical protein
MSLIKNEKNNANQKKIRMAQALKKNILKRKEQKKIRDGKK